MALLLLEGRLDGWADGDGTSGWKNDWIDATCGAIISGWSVNEGQVEAIIADVGSVNWQT